MSYTIKKTDTSIVAVVPDGQIDQINTDLTLVGKNYSGFGQFINENFVKLLENFASNSNPENPLPGQLWFDTSENRVKVYKGDAAGWATVGSTALADSLPTNIGSGDLWFDTLKKQLYFYSGSALYLIGPDYSAAQGKSGIEIVTVFDESSNPKQIMKWWLGSTLIGILSKEEFNLKQDIVIDGFVGSTIFSGFNLANIPNAGNFKFRLTATNADQLGGRAASSYLRTDISGSINGSLSVSGGMTVGDTDQYTLSIVNGNITISNTAVDRTLSFNVRGAGGSQTAIALNPIAKRVSMYSGDTASEVRMGGNLIVDGDLTVKGSSANVTTTNLLVKDKLVELNSPDVGVTVTDTDADGGGINLNGTNNHFWKWSNSEKAWETNESINLVEGPNYVPTFKINGITVLSATTLGNNIAAPGITSLGPQTLLTVDQLFLNNNRILSQDIVGQTTANIDIELEPKGAGNVALIGSPKITGLADPTGNQDAATKYYVDTVVTSRNFVFSLDITGLNNTGIISILNDIAPPIEYGVGALARISTTKQNLSGVSYQPTLNVTYSTVLDVDNEPVLRDAATQVDAIPASTVTVERGLRVFQVQQPNPLAPKVWVPISTEEPITYPRP